MSGWRDESGRTAADRKKIQEADERARLSETVRHRPLRLVKPALAALFISILVFALVSGYF